MKPYDSFLARDLIEDAMRGVRVQPCPHCHGIGESLSGPCKPCEQTGTIVTTELEVPRA